MFLGLWALGSGISLQAVGHLRLFVKFVIKVLKRTVVGKIRVLTCLKGPSLASAHSIGIGTNAGHQHVKSRKMTNIAPLCGQQSSEIRREGLHAP